MRLTVFVCSAMLLACASSGSQPLSSSGDQTVRVVGNTGSTRIDTHSTGGPIASYIDAPVQAAWLALDEAYRVLAIEVTHRDPARRTLGNPSFRTRRRIADTPISRFLDCGRAQGSPSADFYEVHLSVMSEATIDADGRTVVSTAVEASATPVNFTAEPVRCSSTGELEKRIANVVRAGTAR